MPPREDRTEERPPRSIVVMARDFPPEQLEAVFNRFKRKVRRNRPTPGFVDRWSSLYRGLGTIILPISADEALESRIIQLGSDGVIEIDDERISFAPPGADPIERPVDPPADPLDATRVLKSGWSGDGQIVMILDVGLDVDHVDFKLRNPAPTVTPFVTNPLARDTGHGTRSAGLACGPEKPHSGARYGVAHKADLIVGQVVSLDSGIPDEALIAGLQSAIDKKVTVVNMSLGLGVGRTSSYNRALELIAQRALKAGVLPIAAAGNDGSHLGTVPVNHPANCPSVLSIGAVDGSLRPWLGSCIRVRCDAEVDMVAPGYEIRSSTTEPERYNTVSSTSSATAIASGIAALWAEAKKVRGCDLWNVMLDNVVSVVGGRRATTGAGLVQAPP